MAEIKHPKGHLVGVAVPKGGSSCANCAKLKPPLICEDEYFQKWNESDEIPSKTADTYCCDMWSRGEAKKKTLSDQLRERKER